MLNLPDNHVKSWTKKNKYDQVPQTCNITLGLRLGFKIMEVYLNSNLTWKVDYIIRIQPDKLIMIFILCEAF